jgi:CRISPR/Cas system CMR-associated protein Cmr3 (group 5 of RAMP superfamily)
MEENTQKIEKIEVINKDAILQIKFKSDFYDRLILVLKSTFDGKTPEELQKAASQIENKKVEEEWILNYETMLYLIRSVEDYAKQNNLTTMVDINEFLKHDDLQ